MNDRDELGLPDGVRLVLAATARIAAARMGDEVDAAKLAGSIEGVRGLLPLLAGSAGLRALLRRELGGPLRPPADDLLSPDPDICERGCAAVGKLLDEARRSHRRASRAQRRANRPDADTRRTTRLEQRITQLRSVRDRLDGQVATLTAENAELRTTIENLDEELEQLRRHLDVAYARLDRVQAERDEALRVGEPAPRAAVGADLAVSVRVLGGGTEIGGSCVLISAGGTRLLVDAGTRPTGVDADSLAPAGVGEILDAPPDAIVVTHAHNDHAGWVPALLNRFGDVPVFASTATCDLLGTMWADSAKVLALRADRDETWAGGPLPPYAQADVDAAVAALVDVPIGRSRRIGTVSFELFDAGHIVGAAGVVVTAGDRRVVVSGDVSGPGQLSVGGLRLPDSAIGADLLLLESTYAGAGKPPPREAVIEQFVSDVDRILGAGGRVLVPAFALGRAQEIALICGRHLPDAEVLVDGLARDLSHAYRRHDGPDGEHVQVFSGRVRPVEPGRTRREIADKRPCVVVATSGMLSGGPAVGWARQILAEPESGLMVVGYQDADSPGARLLNLAAAGGGRFDLPDDAEPVNVTAHVGSYRLGAHASEEELVEIAARARPRTLMLVHGRLAAQRRFAERLRLRQQNVILADETWTSR